MDHSIDHRCHRLGRSLALGVRRYSLADPARALRLICPPAVEGENNIFSSAHFRQSGALGRSVAFGLGIGLPDQPDRPNAGNSVGRRGIGISSLGSDRKDDPRQCRDRPYSSGEPIGLGRSTPLLN